MRFYLLLTIVAMLISSSLQAGADVERSNELDLPPKHPYLADSHYPILHGNMAATPISTVAGPMDRSRRLHEDEIAWRPFGFGNGWEINYSGPYKNGRRALWAGGASAFYKLDADSLEVLSTYTLEGKHWSERETRQAIAHVDAMIPAARNNPDVLQNILDYLANIITPILRSTGAGALYRFLSDENEQYVMNFDPLSRAVSINVYGDAVVGDIESDIVKKRSWTVPAKDGGFAIGIAMGMTYDGHVILVLSDGRVYALSRDLTQQQHIQLPGNASGGEGYMGAFVRNGIAIDDDGGIYIVTRTFMHRLQWTGEKLSLQEEQGAWKVPYLSGKNGSGATPTLMGWGDKQDRLVLISDGADKVSINLYWRDAIPDDWEGIPGHPRRLAGRIPLSFGKHSPDSFTMEASPLVYQYGIFIPNDTSKTPPPPQGSLDKEIFAKYHSLVSDSYSIRGGVRYDWNPDRRRLEQTWLSDLELCPTICTYAANGMLYCYGRRGGEYSMEVLDWATGKPVFHYLLGDSFRYNDHAAVIRIAPNGAVDCPCAMGSSLIRIQPRQN